MDFSSRCRFVLRLSCSHRPLVAACLVVPLVGCGSTHAAPPADQAPGSRAPQQMRTDPTFADQYYIDDLSCQSSGSGTADLGTMPVSKWQDGSTQQVAFGFTGGSSAGSVHGPGIVASLYNFYQTDACGALHDDSSCSTTPKVAQAPEALQICRPSGTYPRTSVEGVALASLATLTTAANFYLSVPTHDAGIASATVLVLPTIEKTYDNGAERTVATDNLAYTPDYGGQPAFVVYPKGQQALQLGLWNNLNLWELPWGLAHEYGHHVFRTHTHIGVVRGEGLDAGMPIHRGLDLATSGTRTPLASDVLGAVNESYADLFSFYVWGAKPGLVKGVDCFDLNREVTSAVYATGQAKILTAEVLATFYSTQIVPSGSCQEPSYQDIHAVGAIVAHAVDQVFSAVAGGESGADVAVKKAQMLLAWANRIGDSFSLLSVAAGGTTQLLALPAGQGGLTFDMLVKNALLAAAPDGKLPAAACADLATAFPDLIAGWKASGISCQ